MSDEQIDMWDIPGLDDEFFRHAKVRLPTGKRQGSRRVDSDVLD